MNFRYKAAELEPLLADCEAQAVVYTASIQDELSKLEAPGVRWWLRLEDVPESRPVLHNGTRWEEVADASPTTAVEHNHGELMVYTGGTTGRPKGVVWGMAELLEIQTYSAYGTLGVTPPTTMDEAVAIAVDPDVPHEVVLPLAPLMHGTALFTSMNALLTGGTVVMLPTARFDAAAASEIIQDNHVNRLIVAGDAIALPLVEEAAAHQVDWSSVNSIMSSGMRFSDEVKARIHELTDVTITDLLASSEGGPYAVAATSSVADLPSRLSLFPGAVVLDDDDREVQDLQGATGMLAYGGKLPKGYHGDPVKTAQTFRMLHGHRYVAAGDMVRTLGGGYIELLGRGSAVVNTGGEKVFPAEVEEVLLEHPAVEDAAVFGVPDPRFGEAVVAAVALHDGAAVTAEELSGFVGDRLAGYKKPRKILIRSSLDRSPSGKLSLAKLKQAVIGLKEGA
jgi:fatty-acyl-CoA synthase